MTATPITRRAALTAGAAVLVAPRGTVLVAPRGKGADASPLALGPAEPLPAGLHGFNSNILTATAFRGMTYGDPRVAAAVAAFRPRVLRFPGGTIANNYLWREDSFSEPADDKTGWAGEQLRLFRKIGRPYDLPGFAALCRRFEVEPVWVLNVYEETPESVPDLCRRWDELGTAGAAGRVRERAVLGRAELSERPQVRRVLPAAGGGAAGGPAGRGGRGLLRPGSHRRVRLPRELERPAGRTELVRRRRLPRVPRRAGVRAGGGRGAAGRGHAAA